MLLLGKCRTWAKCMLGGHCRCQTRQLLCDTAGVRHASRCAALNALAKNLLAGLDRCQSCWLLGKIWVQWPKSPRSARSKRRDSQTVLDRS